MKSAFLLPALALVAVGCSKAPIVAETDSPGLSRRDFQRQEHDLGYYSYSPSPFRAGPAVIGRPGMPIFLR
jgi:hypothetical protein